MRRTGIALLDNRATKNALIEKLSRARLPLNLVDRLVGIEQDELGKSRRPRIMKQLDAVFSEVTNRDEDDQADPVSDNVHSIYPPA